MEHGLNKTLLHTALLALSFPFSLYGLGLGQMTVKSSLDQPFLAEIDVLDVGGLPSTSIKVGVADPENFEEIGLDRAAVLSLLHFKLEKNAQGTLVVRVQSTERMVDPYMELVVDMAWPKGQLYKAYTVLLDPPGYQLVLTTIQGSPTRYRKSTTFSNQPGVINKTVHTTVAHNPPLIKDRKKQTTYGPTISHDNVWQIAQRYKTSEIILPQVVLALVGANPEAFKDGNLNGLKVGVRLIIPATHEISHVPAELATEEVMAHDKAWNDKSSINHVINPPYIHSEQVSDATLVGDHVATPVPTVEHNSSALSSTIPAIPKFNASSTMDAMPQLISASNHNVHVHKIPQSTENYSRTKAELDITAAAVESVRESNALLMEQLHLLQEQNKQLQLQLQQRDQEMEQMRVQIQQIVKQRLAVAAQTSSPHKESSSLWLPIFLLLLAAGGGGLAYWYFKLRDTEDETIIYTSEPLMDAKLSFEESMADMVIDEPDQVTPVDEHRASATGAQSPQAIKNQEDTINKVSNSLVNEPNQLLLAEPISEELDAGTDSLVSEGMTDDVIKAELPEPAQVAEIYDTYEIENHTNTPHTSAVEDSLTKHLRVPEQQQEEDHLLEFESGLHELIAKKVDVKSLTEPNHEAFDGLDFTPSHALDDALTKTPNQEQAAEQSYAAAQSDDLELDPRVSEFFAEHNLDNTADVAQPGNECNSVMISDAQMHSPLKSFKALDTLLALARTYASMDDFESARSSLEEVVTYGNDKQRHEALCLLEDIKNK